MRSEMEESISSVLNVYGNQFCVYHEDSGHEKGKKLKYYASVEIQICFCLHLLEAFKSNKPQFKGVSRA